MCCHPTQSGFGNSFQLPEILLFGIPNKACYIINVAWCGYVWMLVLNGDEKETKVSEEEDWRDGVFLGYSCVDWLEVFSFATKRKSGLPA